MDRAISIVDGHQMPAEAGPAGGRTLSLLGEFELRQEGRLLPLPLSTQRLVAFLGLDRARKARMYVAGHLWTDSSDERACAALRTTLWRLGRPCHGLIRCEGQSLRLDPGVFTDVSEVTRVASGVLAGREEIGLQRALEILRGAGELLPDWYEDWVIIERERIRQLRLHALERLCSLLSAAGRHADATNAGIIAVASEPLRESAHRVLIAAHLAEGNAGEALRQYDVCRRLLRRDLGIVPSEALEVQIAHLRPGGDRPVTRRV